MLKGKSFRQRTVFEPWILKIKDKDKPKNEKEDPDEFFFFLLEFGKDNGKE